MAQTTPKTLEEAQRAQKPITLGRDVMYVLDYADCTRVEALRRDGVTINQVRAGQLAPAKVVAVMGDTVNLQVFLDGARQLWVTSVAQTTADDAEVGCWHWPVLV